MSHIWVCGLDEVESVAERVRPGRLISLLPANEQPPTPLGMRASDHLRVLVDDIERPGMGLSAPARSHVRELIRFLRACPPRASVLIHCFAGVSRSPAAALIALALDAPGREHEAATALRRAAPFACPNRLLVELADAALGRQGALAAAREAMGEPDRSCELAVFRVARNF